MDIIISVIGWFFVLVGAAFLFLGGLGILRMPDILNRSQAGTKASTLGIVSLLIGISFLNGNWAPKLIIIAFFFLATSPIASHAITKAALKRGRAKIILKKNDYDQRKEGF